MISDSFGKPVVHCETDVLSTARSEGNVTRYETRLGAVYRLEARVLPYLTGSVYLFPSRETTGFWTLVDAGSGGKESSADLKSAFAVVRERFDPSFSPSAIRRILLTHAHIDHFGGVYELTRMNGAEVWLHAFESRVVSAYDACAIVENMRYVNFLRECGIPDAQIEPILDGFGFRPGRAKSVPVARKLLGGERFDSIDVVYLPGHSSGHVAYLYGDVVFTGDLLLSKTLTQIWPARTTPQTGLLNYISSLMKLRELAESYERARGCKLVAFAAHEEPILDIPERVARAFRGLERRNQRLLGIMREENAPLSIAEIMPKMYWSGRPNREFFALSDVASRVELLLQLGAIQIVDYERVSPSSPTLWYRPSFSDTKATENTVEQVLRMNAARNETQLFERKA